MQLFPVPVIMVGWVLTQQIILKYNKYSCGNKMRGKTLKEKLNSIDESFAGRIEHREKSVLKYHFPGWEYEDIQGYFQLVRNLSNLDNYACVQLVLYPGEYLSHPNQHKREVA